MSQPHDRAPRYIRLLLYSSGAWYFGEGMIAPFFSLYTNSIGGSILDITWVWATYLIIAGIFTVLVGKVSDTWISKEKLIIIEYERLNASIIQVLRKGSYSRDELLRQVRQLLATVGRIPVSAI